MNYIVTAQRITSDRSGNYRQSEQIPAFRITADANYIARAKAKALLESEHTVKHCLCRFEYELQEI